MTRKARGILALVSEITALLNGAVQSALRLTNNLLSMGFKMAFKFNEEAMAFSRQVGLSAKQAQAYTEVLTNRAKELGQRYGIAAEEVTKLEKNLARATGRVIMLNEAQADRQIQINRTVGEQTADQFSQMMMRTMGAQLNTVQGAVSKAYAIAAKSGLDAAGMSSKVGQNLAMANRLTFRNGINGLIRMVALSEKLGINVQSIENVANKFMDLQDAIENSAKLSMLGGAAGAFGGNPLDMTYEANYDPEELAERTAKMLGGYAHFDPTEGIAKMNAMSRDFVKGIGEAIGMGLDEAVSVAKKQAEIKYKELNFAGDINKFAFDKETGRIDQQRKDFLLNKSQYDTKTGKLTLGGHDLDYYNTGQGKKLLDEMMRIQGLTDEELMKEQATAVISINDTIQGYITTIQGVLANSITPYMGNIKKFAGDIYHMILPHVGAIADNIKKLIGTFFTPENLKDTKNKINMLISGVMKAAEWLTSSWPKVIGAMLVTPLLGTLGWILQTLRSIRAAMATGGGGAGARGGGYGPGGYGRGATGAGGIPKDRWGREYAYRGTSYSNTYKQNYNNARSTYGYGRFKSGMHGLGAAWKYNKGGYLRNIGVGALGGMVGAGLMMGADDEGIANGNGVDTSMYIGGGLLSGLSTGAAIGSMFGPWGTAIGGAIGAIGGLASSWSQASELQDEYNENLRKENERKRNARPKDTMTAPPDGGNHYLGAESPRIGDSSVTKDPAWAVATGKLRAQNGMDDYFALLRHKEGVYTRRQIDNLNSYIMAKPYDGVTHVMVNNSNNSGGVGGEVRFGDLNINLGGKLYLAFENGYETSVDVEGLMNSERFGKAIMTALLSRPDFIEKISRGMSYNSNGGLMRGPYYETFHAFNPTTAGHMNNGSTA